MKKIFIAVLLFISVDAWSQSKAFIPKQDHDLPDSYGMTVNYVTGKQEIFSLAAHTYNRETNTIEFWTKDDIHNWIPMNNVLRIEFDKNFSKMVSIKEKLAREQKEKEAIVQKNLSVTPVP